MGPGYNEEGYPYWFNTLTGESSWTAPPEQQVAETAPAAVAARSALAASSAGDVSELFGAGGATNISGDALGAASPSASADARSEGVRADEVPSSAGVSDQATPNEPAAVSTATLAEAQEAQVKLQKQLDSVRSAAAQMAAAQEAEMADLRSELSALRQQQQQQQQQARSSAAVPMTPAVPGKPVDRRDERREPPVRGGVAGR